MAHPAQAVPFPDREGATLNILSGGHEAAETLEQTQVRSVEQQDKRRIVNEELAWQVTNCPGLLGTEGFPGHRTFSLLG